MEGAQQIIYALKKEGFPAYIVGGAVRDILLGKEPKDIDVVTKAKPEEVIAIMERRGFSCTDLVGKSFGVVVVTNEYGHYEVATFRKERYGADSHRPEEITYADTLEEDVQRRDFTVNGLAMDSYGNIVDYVGGQKDIKRKLLRTIGKPEERFSEDALRLFRACRFVGQLQFDADPHMLRAMPKAFYRVKGLSLERVKIELEKLLLSPSVAKGLDILVQSGLANETCKVVRNGAVEEIPILPELFHLVDLPQEAAFHKYDGWLHTLVCVQESRPDLTIRWAALLHDVGKGMPEVRAIRKGRMTDHGHDDVGATMAKDILFRLGYTEKFANRVSWLVQNHMRFHYFAMNDEADPVKWMRKEARSGLYRNASELEEACSQLCDVCVADAIATGRQHASTEGIETFGECLQDICTTMPIHTRDLAYGPELITLCGKHVKDVLPLLVQQVQNGVVENTAEALYDSASRWLKRNVTNKEQ